MRAICQGRLLTFGNSRWYTQKRGWFQDQWLCIGQAKSSTSAGNQNPALRSTNFNLFTQPPVFKGKETSVVFDSSGILLVSCMNDIWVWRITGMTLAPVNQNTGTQTSPTATWSMANLTRIDLREIPCLHEERQTTDVYHKSSDLRTQ